MTFTRESCVVVSDEQVSTTLGDEAVILGMRDGVYYGLDVVGARIWTLLATPRRVSDIVRAVSQEFDVSTEQCERDVFALLESLSDRELIREHRGESDVSLP